MEKEKYLNWLLIPSVRYALNRDNGLAIANFKMTFLEVIKWYKDNFMRNYIINKIADEIMRDLQYNNRKDEKDWLHFVKHLIGTQ